MSRKEIDKEIYDIFQRIRMILAHENLIRKDDYYKLSVQIDELGKLLELEYENENEIQN